MMKFSEFLSDTENHLARYLEYKAHSDGIDIEEAARRSIGRLFSQLEKGNEAYVIISAFRGTNSLAANRRANMALANDIRGLGWGFTPVLGGFVETSPDPQGQPQERRVHEESYFVAASGDPTSVKRGIVGLLHRYQQEAALLKLPGDDQALFINQAGATNPVGQWKADPKLMAIYYTRMRHGAPNRQFTFEAAGDGSVMTRTIVDAYFRNK